MKNAAAGTLAIILSVGISLAQAQTIDWNSDPVSQVSLSHVRLLAAATAESVAKPNLSPASLLNEQVGAIKLGDAHLNTMFHDAIAETGKEAAYEPDGTVYVKTGDIPAQWLRDSSAELRPYLFFAKGNTEMDNFLKAAITREFRYIAIDPYADAFNEDYSVHEEKFELDSLLYPISLAWTYWKVTGDARVFSPDVVKGLKIALATMQDEQDHPSSPKHYPQPRIGLNPANWLSGILPALQIGHHPVAWTGMIWTGFRPSDDPCLYNYLIPSEMMAVVSLGQLAEIESSVLHDSKTAQAATELQSQVQAGIKAYGTVDVKGSGKIYAYEVDGLGHYNLMDDGNIPSLLSAPYLGYVSATDPTYAATRKFLLSPKNPYFYKGRFAQGIGSPHTPEGRLSAPKGYVWPLALLSQALTSSGAPQQKALSMLMASDPGDGLLHESFDANNPKRMTRPDFGWPNALFAEFLLKTQGGKAPLPMPPLPTP